MNHSLSASASALREFNSLRCAVSTTFFVFVKFSHRSGEVVFVSAVREATQSSTACQQLFSTFRFFLSLDALSSSRSGKLFVSALAVNNFFQLSKNSFFRTLRQPVVTALSLCLSNSRPAFAFRNRPAREAFMDSFPTKVKKFFQNVTKKEAALWKEGCFFFCFRKLRDQLMLA